MTITVSGVEVEVPEEWAGEYRKAIGSPFVYTSPVISGVIEQLSLERHLRKQAEEERDAAKRFCEDALDRMASVEMKEHLQTINERDVAEEAFSQAYYLITGKSPEWSNLFGYDRALEDIDDAQKCLRTTIQKADELAGTLRIEGHAGSPIWAMAEGDGTIGLRLDCGDGGVVFLTEQQAREVINAIEPLLGPSERLKEEQEL